MNTNSLAASNELAQCTCLPGYSAKADGLECSACPTGTYTDMGGTRRLSGMPFTDELCLGE